MNWLDDLVLCNEKALKLHLCQSDTPFLGRCKFERVFCGVGMRWIQWLIIIGGFISIIVYLFDVHALWTIESLWFMPNGHLTCHKAMTTLDAIWSRSLDHIYQPLERGKKTATQIRRTPKSNNISGHRIRMIRCDCCCCWAVANLCGCQSYKIELAAKSEILWMRCEKIGDHS